MSTTLGNEQDTLWDTVKYFVHQQEYERAELILKITLEKSLRKMKIYTPVFSEFKFIIRSEDELEDLIKLDQDIRQVVTTFPTEQQFERILDYIQLICKFTSEPTVSNKKMLASIMAIKSRRNIHFYKGNRFLAVNKKGMISPIYYTTGEAAQKLGLSDQTIRRMCENGKFKGAYRSSGGHWRIPEENFITTKEHDEKTQQFIERIDQKNIKAGDVDEFDL